jgi:hypothetical protein
MTFRTLGAPPAPPPRNDILQSWNNNNTYLSQFSLSFFSEKNEEMRGFSFLTQAGRPYAFGIGFLCATALISTWFQYFSYRKRNRPVVLFFGDSITQRGWNQDITGFLGYFNQ